MKFEAEYTDRNLSPYTGLTRKSWIAAGKYLLGGIFKNLQSIDAPMVMPRAETEVTYPHLSASPETQDAERRAEIFEGLTRSFFIASVLIHEEPDIELNGIRLREYYAQHIMRSCCRKDDPAYVSTYEELQEITHHADPMRAFQQTVETCALVIGLWACREEIWERYEKDEQDALAAFLKSFAHANTVPQNWRLFNMLDMAFLNSAGYDINRNIMRDHAQAILHYYAGDGWYRDGQSFDYYSCWAFNFYAPLWNQWYGYENEPYFAERFEQYSNKLMETYPDFFDKDGYTNMWGRSCIYRFAAVSSFDGNLMLKNHSADPGLARRICSGSLLQFLTRDDFLSNGIPSLGFYGQFTPLVQGYSCAESPFWLGKAFMCLHMQEDHPFWTARERNGIWEGLGQDGIIEHVLDGPALCVTDHGANGETVLRTGKVVKAPDDLHGMWNYAKLCYNSKYPWEALPDGEGDVSSQQYLIKDMQDEKLKPLQGNLLLWSGAREGVLYRRVFFNYDLKTETHWLQAIDIADFPYKAGIMRVDRLRLFRRPVQVMLGSYGFPDNGTQIEKRTCGKFQAVILKGHDHTGRDRMMAMTVMDGWEELEVARSSGTNPDSPKSIIINASMKCRRQYDSSEPYVLISQVITKESAEEFSDDELFPAEGIDYTDAGRTGCYGPITLHMKDGSIIKVDHEGMESGLML